MNNPAQLEFYNPDDVYMSYLPSFNYPAPQRSLPGYWNSERLMRSDQPNILRQCAYAEIKMNICICLWLMALEN